MQDEINAGKEAACSYLIHYYIREMTSFQHPSLDELQHSDGAERMNIFRRFFASSRYNRLLIQQVLVRSALDKTLASKVVDLEKAHNEDFREMLDNVDQFGFHDEFMAAAKEEDDALQKIIEAYDKRMAGKG
ncbi:MAG: hypothetical protein ACREBU_10245 [Nitrososphaera sp.]